MKYEHDNVIRKNGSKQIIKCDCLYGKGPFDQNWVLRGAICDKNSIKKIKVKVERWKSSFFEKNEAEVNETKKSIITLLYNYIMVRSCLKLQIQVLRY